jgi:hypothetical protein
MLQHQSLPAGFPRGSSAGFVFRDCPSPLPVLQANDHASACPEHLDCGLLRESIAGRVRKSRTIKKIHKNEQKI